MTKENEALRKIVNLDEVIHTPVRMAILLFLNKHPIASFPELKIALGVTSGNLSSHLSKLEKARFIQQIKKFIGTKPSTQISLTVEGLKSINEYKSMVQELLSQM